MLGAVCSWCLFTIRSPNADALRTFPYSSSFVCHDLADSLSKPPIAALRPVTTEPDPTWPLAGPDNLLPTSHTLSQQARSLVHPKEVLCCDKGLVPYQQTFGKKQVCRTWCIVGDQNSHDADILRFILHGKQNKSHGMATAIEAQQRFPSVDAAIGPENWSWTACTTSTGPYDVYNASPATHCMAIWQQHLPLVSLQAYQVLHSPEPSIETHFSSERELSNLQGTDMELTSFDSLSQRAVSCNGKCVW